jgi:Transposase DDE domain group 1
LYIFCGDHLLCARLRPADIDASAGALKQVQRIVARIRQTWPHAKIVIRGDSGFCRDPIMTWCDASGIDYVFGLAKNPRLLGMITQESEQARLEYEQTKQSARVFAELRYETRKSWSRERRIVAKAEHLDKGANPRFVVTSLDLQQYPAKDLYEKEYCERGEMENRIKEQQRHLFADRTSAATMRANQIRLFFSSIAYTLLEALRRLGLAGTSMAQAQCQTIRLRLLKIGALVQVTVRKVWVRLASSCPSADVFREAFHNLDKLRPVVLQC